MSERKRLGWLFLLWLAGMILGLLAPVWVPVALAYALWVRGMWGREEFRILFLLLGFSLIGPPLAVLLLPLGPPAILFWEWRRRKEFEVMLGFLSKWRTNEL
jgi:hypothetical protein